MSISRFVPYSPDSYYVKSTSNIYAWTPVVRDTAADGQVMVPGGAGAGNIVGVAIQDAGPLTLAQGPNLTVVPVQQHGRVQMYAKGTVTAGDVVKIGTSISFTPPGYATAQTLFTAQTATQTAAGSQPAPVLGYAESTSGGTDGDTVWVYLIPGMMY